MAIVLDGTAGITTPDLTDTSLTSGRVVYAGTSGNLTGDSNLTYDGTVLNLTGTSREFRSTITGGASNTRLGNDGVYGSNTNVFLYAPLTKSLVFYANDAEVGRFTSTGLGIGTSSPANNLHVYGGNASAKVEGSGTSNSTQFIVKNPTSNFYMALDNNSGGSFGVANAGFIWIDSANPIVFATNNSMRARITSDGHFLVKTTTATGFQDGLSLYQDTGNSQLIIGHGNGATSGNAYAGFLYNGSVIGNITQNGTTAVAYNTTSDYRLKNTIAPMTGALAKVAQLKPVTYKWKADNSNGEGFIAHELAEVVPHAVTGAKDAVDADGNPVHQGIDVSFLVATLTAAIQEQQALITTLTERITALEGA